MKSSYTFVDSGEIIMNNKRRAHANKCIVIQNIDLSKTNISFDKKALHLLLRY